MPKMSDLAKLTNAAARRQQGVTPPPKKATAPPSKKLAKIAKRICDPPQPRPHPGSQEAWEKQVALLRSIVRCDARRWGRIVEDLLGYEPPEEMAQELEMLGEVARRVLEEVK